MPAGLILAPAAESFVSVRVLLALLGGVLVGLSTGGALAWAHLRYCRRKHETAESAFLLRLLLLVPAICAGAAGVLAVPFAWHQATVGGMLLFFAIAAYVDREANEAGITAMYGVGILGGVLALVAGLTLLQTGFALVGLLFVSGLLAFGCGPDKWLDLW